MSLCDSANASFPSHSNLGEASRKVRHVGNHPSLERRMEVCTGPWIWLICSFSSWFPNKIGLSLFIPPPRFLHGHCLEMYPSGRPNVVLETGVILFFFFLAVRKLHVEKLETAGKQFPFILHASRLGVCSASHLVCLFVHLASCERNCLKLIKSVPG